MKFSIFEKTKKALYMSIFAIFAFQLSFPGFILASLENTENSTITKPLVEIEKSFYTTVTAYSSTVDQTDSTPCITANGYNLCKNNKENVAAANFLPFGAEIRIPEYFGERVFTVQDRMHARFPNRVDVWMKDRNSALVFGMRNLKIEILKEAEPSQLN